MTPAWTRWWRPALLTALALVGLVLVAGWLVLRVWGPAFTRERVETVLSDALGQPVRVGSVRLRLWRLNVSLADLDVPGASGMRLRAGSVDVGVDVASLWRRRILLSARAADLDFEMTVPERQGGGASVFPLPEFFTVGPLHIGIGKVRFTNARAVVRWQDPALTLDLAGADVTARPAAGDLEISGQLDTLRVEIAGHREQFDRVALDGRLAADLVRVRRIDWRWQGEPLRLEGEVRHPWVESVELSLRVKGDVSLAAVAAAAGLERRIAGKAQVTGEITGPVAAIQVGGRIQIPELGIDGIALHEVGADVRWADRRLRLDNLRARLGAGRVEGRLEAAVLSGGGTSLALDLRQVVLPGDWGRLGSGTAVAEGKIHDGVVDVVRVEARWRGLTASADGRVATGAPLALRARLTADLAEVARSLRWPAMTGQAGVAAELTGRGGTPMLEGNGQVDNFAVGGRAVEPVRLAFRMASSPGPNMRWEGTVDSARMASSGVAVEDVALSLTVDGKRIELTRARARMATVPIEATGQWEWTGSGRGHAVLGPASFAQIPGVPASLRLGGTGRATVDATAERGVTSAKALVEMDAVSAAGVSLGAGRSEVRVRGRSLEAELTFPARRLQASASGLLEAGGTISGRLAFDDLALEPLLKDLAPSAADQVVGRVSGRAEMAIPFDRPSSGRGIARLTPDGLRLFGDPWASQGPIVLRWEAPRFLVESFRLQGPSGGASVTGDLLGPGDLSVALDNTRLPGALAELGRGTLRADVHLGNGAFMLRKFDARWPRLTAVASGQSGADGSIDFTAHAEVDLAGIGPALGIAGAQGRVALSADARGRRGAVEGAGSLRAPRIEIGGARVSDVEVPLRLSRSTLRMERAHATLGGSRVSADASATWTGTELTVASLTRDVRFAGALRAPSVRLEDVTPLLPPALRGRGDVALSARGEGTPSAWHGAGSLASQLVELPAGPLRRLDARFSADQTRVDLTELRVDALGVPTSATASWAWTGGGTVKAALGPAPLARISVVTAGIRVEGTGRATIDAAGRSLADVAGAAHVTVDDLTLNDVRLGRGRLDVSGKDGVYRAELAFPEQKLQASGTARVVDAGNALSAELSLPAVDVGLLAKALWNGTVPLGGTLSARATGRVPLGDPRRGDGVLSIDPIRLVVSTETWESGGPVQIRWAQGAASVAPFRLDAKDGSVSGSGTLTADGELDARVAAKLPLAMLRDVRPEIREIGGVAELTARASGRLAAPALAGDGAIHGGNLLLRDRPETLRDLEARFALSTQGVQLKEATALVSGGRVQAQGDLALRDWRPSVYRVRLKAQGVALAQIGGFSSAWDADLELGGLTREAQLTGRARLVRGLYNRDLSIVSLVLSPSRAAAADTGTPLRLRLRIDVDDNLVVRTRVANLRAGGVLNVEGTTARPIVFGSVESRDGRIVFRNRSWSITTATVRFADPRRVDPFLDVVATSRIGDYDVTMQIGGPVSNVNVRFSSTPRLAQNDLLSLVAFGVTGADLKESPSTVLLSEAGALLAQNVLGVDPGSTGLRISTGSAASGRMGELQGFHGEERSISSARNTPGSGKDTVRVEYALWGPIFLSGEYDRESGYGTDVVLRFRFR